MRLPTREILMILIHFVGCNEKVCGIDKLTRQSLITYELHTTQLQLQKAPAKTDFDR